MSDPNPTGAYRPETSELPADQPQRIGRYRVQQILGEGGFGRVYLAHDEQLDRLVAIKVPHRQLVSHLEDAAAYRAEARTAANLDHPHIVPVYDIGHTADCPCFIVSKFIAGPTLARQLKTDRLSVHAAATLVATVAEALHYAHRQGLVHRDVKPGNILLEWRAGDVSLPVPYLVDFGLALREEDVGRGVRYAGTPAYMSPEQARGEGHRVDGRSDIFSLGVVFYELLTGRRPFQGDSREELLERIAEMEPRPPRQYDDTIPKELERICLKALAKRAADRYTTAKDLAEDLRHFLAQQPAGQPASLSGPGSSSVPATPVVPLSGGSATAVGAGASPDSPPVKIVPKGLRSFDAHDADFFLELLPGPRDRDGLPDSIRFWKTRIEETDPDNTFAVGLIYGPSGCGKSSLVKAGLLPRLGEPVLAVYVEATAADTETRLLQGLRKRCPALPANLDVTRTLAALRRGQGLPSGKKILIVLDQFEQWLHARKDEDNTELVQALRQCDGGRVQCLVLVRDDFWMAVTRFLEDLEVDLVKGHNMEAADLFDPRHARNVLAAFGRAFGVLPQDGSPLSQEQQQFLEQAVAELTQEGKIICVRLALFAEMMKGKPWRPATLKAVGGAQGVGVAFLEETFSSPAANPKLRLHQRAARAVLKALLPEAGADIKGAMRSQAELLAVSGYMHRPSDFADLMRLLDSEIRLLTPTDPEGREESESAAGGLAIPDAKPPAAASDTSGRYYQLTHDYLVPALRDWLTRKQKETRRGRAELLLADRAAVWNARPEHRQLPSLPQWLSIRWLTRKQNWTGPQRRMMGAAARYHALRSVALTVLLLILTVTGLTIRHQVIETNQATQAEGLVQRLLDANIAQVPDIVEQMAEFRAWTDPLLRDEHEKAAKHSRQQLHTSLALLPVDDSQVTYLYHRLLDAQPHEVVLLREALRPHQDQLRAKLWTVVERPPPGQEAQRLRAACALASYDPDSKRWDKVRAAIADDLVSVNAVFLGLWSEGFRPVKGRLLKPLGDIFRDRKAERDAERILAANLLADYAADRPQLLAGLLLEANEKQFAILFSKFQENSVRGVTVLEEELGKSPPPAAEHGARATLAKRQANAAVALLRLGRTEKTWRLLQHSPDPTVRSYLVHRLGPLGADPRVVVQRLEKEPDVTIRRALVLCLGSFGDKEFPLRKRKALVQQLQAMYRTAPDAGLHGAVEWLLREWGEWGEGRWLQEINDARAKDKEGRKKRLQQIGKELARGKKGALERLGQGLAEDKVTAPPQWYVNGQGQTMVVIAEPGAFWMGSPLTEKGRFDGEQRHKKRIGRNFALAAKPVTVAEFRRCLKGQWLNKEFAPTADCPMHGMTWFEAAAYCNWLSQREGIPREQWCYETGLLGGISQVKPNYLSLTGYRLPTEAEMEYACRAGATTSRYYGEPEELLGKYGWYLNNASNRSWPVGLLKPNDLGLFDMQGNVWCWCQDAFKAYPQNQEGAVSEDIEDTISMNLQNSRVLRGGAFSLSAVYVRSAYRIRSAPATRSNGFGFRPARTFTAE